MTPSELINRYGIRVLYHFTDKQNIELIKLNGGLYSVEELDRRGIQPPRPGGNNWSRDADLLKGLHRYVHLSFLEYHPMIFIAEREGRIGPVNVLRIDSRILHIPGVLFTADVSNKSGVQLLTLDETLEQIDYELIYTPTSRAGENINERLKKARKCEALIPNHVPLELISNI